MVPSCWQRGGPISLASDTTYHRIDSLAVTLDAIQKQSRPPDAILVVDNGTDPDVRRLCASLGAGYIDAGGNRGPAGAFALAIEHVLPHAGPNDWLVTIGDDDPPHLQDRFERLWDFALAMVKVDDMVAGVGASGARYARRSGRFQRVPDSELIGPVRVDYLAGNQLFHRCEALRQIGTYDSDLFFGFEEADWGLRASTSGWSLWVSGELWLADRSRYNRLGVTRVATPVDTSAWRRYYSARNSTLIAQRFADSRRAVALSALRGAVGGTTALIRARRPLQEVLYPLRGAVDGLKNRTGRTVNPATANKVG